MNIPEKRKFDTLQKMNVTFGLIATIQQMDELLYKLKEQLKFDYQNPEIVKREAMMQTLYDALWFIQQCYEEGMTAEKQCQMWMEQNLKLIRELQDLKEEMEVMRLTIEGLNE